MAWFETTTLVLGVAVAKHILKNWLGEGLPNSVLEELIDLSKDAGEKSLQKRETERQIDRIGEKVANGLKPLFDSEGIWLGKAEKSAVVFELARTLAKSKIDSKLLVECRLDPKALANHFQRANSEATQRFSAREIAVYERMLDQISQEIIEIATNLESFDRHFATRILDDVNSIYEVLIDQIDSKNQDACDYEREYRGAIIQTLNRLEIFGVPQYDAVARRQNLSIAYIAMDVNFQPQRGHKNRIQMGESDISIGEGWSQGPMRQVKSSNRESIDQMLAQTRFLVIHGQAGSGKSTLLQWIAVRSAESSFPPNLASWNNTVPFFIRLRECVQSGFPELEDFPRQIARMIGGKPENWVHQQLKNGRAVVLIDGVDELPSNHRPTVLNQLQQLVSTYPFARYIITSRPHAIKVDLWPEWQEWIEEQGFVEVMMQPMTPSHVEIFLDHWHQALLPTIQNKQEREEIKSNPDGLKRLLKRRPPLRRLASTPLLCAMICALYRDRQANLPSERLKLYQECVDMLAKKGVELT